MKRFLLAALLALPFASGAAVAADLRLPPPAPEAPYIPPPAFTWTGFYVGANVGYGWAGARTSYTPLPTATGFATLLPQSVGNSPNGVLGGVQAGYNWQTGSIVFGIEGDIDGAGLSHTAVVTPVIQNSGVAFPTPSFLSTGERTNWLATLRGRLGFTVTPQMLIYATGGLAWGNVKYSANTSYISAGCPACVAYPVAFTKGKMGWTVGGGMEYAFNTHWSGKLEYLYYNLGTQTAIANPSAANPPFQVGYRWKTTGELVRVGLNYKF